MNTLNLPCIIGAAGNTNVGNCNFNLKNALMNIPLPAGTKFTPAELETFIATITTMLHADLALNRAGVIRGIKGVEKANIDAKTGNWGNGDPYTTADERVGRTYTMEDSCLNQALGSYNGKHGLYEFIHVFAGNVGVGAPTTKNGEFAIKGFALSEIFTGQYDEAMNDTPAQFIHRMVHADAEEWRNRVAFVPGDGNFKDLEGMMSVDLTWIKNSPQVAGAYQISATIACGQINMSAQYGTELLDEALWIVKNQLGNIVTVDGVTENGKGNFVLALLTSDPDYTAGTTFTVSLAAPSVLDAADVSWYESNTAKFPK